MQSRLVFGRGTDTLRQATGLRVTGEDFDLLWLRPREIM